MTSINHGMPSRQPDENEPRDHTDRDILDFIDQTVTRITDADVNEHLREVLDQAGYRRRIPEAMIGYQRAHGHGGISAVGELAGQRLPASKAVMRLAVNARVRPLICGCERHHRHPAPTARRSGHSPWPERQPRSEQCSGHLHIASGSPA